MNARKPTKGEVHPAWIASGAPTKATAARMPMAAAIVATRDDGSMRSPLRTETQHITARAA